MLKRLLDLLLTSFVSFIFSPIIMVLILLVRFKLGSPVLFKQQRPGWLGKPFFVYKFRTMNNHKNDKGELLLDVERLTNFGKWLRSTSLDELPSLWNVLKGEMSLVGPRPLLMEYLPLYNAEQARRHDVKPGITGWAQVNGRNAISWDEKFKLDVWYIDNQSFYLDVKIILLTIKKVLFRVNITEVGHVTSSPFKGSRNES